MNKGFFFCLNVIFLCATSAHAAKACLGEIEEQILPLAESQVKAKGEGIRQSRITLVHNYGCHGGQPLRCDVVSRVAVENENRVWSYFSFQSSYSVGTECAARGNVQTLLFHVLEGEPAEEKKSQDDGAMLRLLGN